MRNNLTQRDIDNIIGKLESGDYSGVEKKSRKLIKQFPNALVLYQILGSALFEQGKVQNAVACYRRALKIEPRSERIHLSLGWALQALGKLDEAVASYRTAIEIEPDYAEAFNNLGLALQGLGRLDEAVAGYRKAIEIKPEFAQPHYNLGGALQALGELDAAAASYRKALQIVPRFGEAHNNLGNVLKDLGELDAAVASYRQALRIKPDHVEAHSNLAELLEKTNRTEALREAVTDARRHCPGHPLLALREAQLLKRDGEHAAARALLEEAGPVADARVMAMRASLLGELCDRLGDVDAAYDHFCRGNLLGRETPEAAQADAARFRERIDVLAERFTADWIADWQALESPDDPPAPVFLVGFPRSGTTLLDTILLGHPDVAVVEEMPTVDRVRQALAQLPGGDPDGLAKLDAAGLAELRRGYFGELDKHLQAGDRPAVVVDKQPMNMVEAGLIHRVFPQARFLLALRHPCDCVLSCFMQSFRLNDATANFLDLEDAARLYDKAMTLWQHYQAVLPLAVHTVRYEALVEAFEETLTPLLAFLGLEWHDGMQDYAETARRRGRIDTASYDQVTQPLYTRARGRWERYRAQLQPVLPVLLPWADRLGYGGSGTQAER